MIDGKFNYFTNNILVGVKKNKGSAALVNFISTSENDFTRNNMEVSGNVGTSSEDSGFQFMATSCDK